MVEQKTTDVTLLGCNVDIEFVLSDVGLKVITPLKVVDEMAIVFKIEL